MSARLPGSLWVASLLVRIVLAQVSDVSQCHPSYQWSINSKGQTPCLVAAYLESACGKSSIVNAIPVGTHYRGPTIEDVDECQCSSVTYSLISACAGCQQRTYLNWTTWRQNCSQKYEIFLPPLPTVVLVPSWALLDVRLTNGTFDPSVAAANAGFTLITTTTTFQVPPTTPFATPTTSSSAPSTTGPNIAAIAGGTLGALIAVLLIVVGLLMKKRANEAPKDIVFDRTALVSGNITSQSPGYTYRQTSNDTSYATPSSPSYSYRQTSYDFSYATPSPTIYTSSPSVTHGHGTLSRSLEGPSEMYFGTTLQPNRYGGFRASDSESNH